MRTVSDWIRGRRIAFGRRLLRVTDEGPEPAAGSDEAHQLEEHLQDLETTPDKTLRANMVPVVAAARLLRSVDVPAAVVAAALRTATTERRWSQDWISILLRLEELGKQNHLWRDGIGDEASYEARVVRNALESQGPGRSLMFELARLVKLDGRAELEKILAELGAWAENAGLTGWRRVSFDDEAPRVAPSEVPQPKTRDQPARPNPELVEELVALNVNGHLGCEERATPDGWYTIERGRERLVLLTSTLSKRSGLYLKLRGLGLLQGFVDGVNAGWDRVFSVVAGGESHEGYAIDLWLLRTLVGEEHYAQIPSAFQSNPNATVNVEAMRLSERPLPCPKCSTPLQVTDGVKTYYACPSTSCGFSVLANDKGVPHDPRLCERCGQPCYLGKRGHWVHHRNAQCGSGKPAKKPQPGQNVAPESPPTEEAAVQAAIRDRLTRRAEQGPFPAKPLTAKG